MDAKKMGSFRRKLQYNVKTQGVTVIWYHHGKIHREGGNPAIIKNGTKSWFYKNLRHREDNLPAIFWACGTRWWFKNGKFYLRKDKHTL